jgi:hypothetical protein
MSVYRCSSILPTGVHLGLRYKSTSTTVTSVLILWWVNKLSYAVSVPWLRSRTPWMTRMHIQMLCSLYCGVFQLKRIFCVPLQLYWGNALQTLMTTSQITRFVNPHDLITSSHLQWLLYFISVQNVRPAREFYECYYTSDICNRNSQITVDAIDVSEIIMVIDRLRLYLSKIRNLSSLSE